VDELRKTAVDKAPAKPSSSLTGIFKTAASLEKKMTGTAKQAHTEVYGDSGATETSNDRQQVLALLSQVLDCLRITLGRFTT